MNPFLPPQGLLLALALLPLLSSCGGSAPDGPRVVVLGIDGLDPVMLAERIERGLCPNLGKLVAEGTFSPLGTSWPPQSPVAWSNFITGANPGRHGLFDFVHPNRAERDEQPQGRDQREPVPCLGAASPHRVVSRATRIG